MDASFPWWIGFGALGIFIVGLLVGLLFGRSRQRAARRGVEELEAALRQSREETGRYRAQVAQHFNRTAELLQVLTTDYRAVYDHLASGAQALGDGRVESLPLTPLHDRLLTEVGEGAALGEPAARHSSSLHMVEANHPPPSEAAQTKESEVGPMLDSTNVKRTEEAPIESSAGRKA